MSHRDMVQDRLLGMLAVEKRFIIEKQLKECMNIIELFEPDTKLKEILLRKKYLTKAQIQRLESELFPDEMMEDSAPAAQKQPAFGEIALERNMIDQSQLEKALEEQQKYVTRGIRPQIGQVMFKIGFLTLPQVKKVLEAQLKKVLVCKMCGIKKVIFDSGSNIIHQCEKCGLDLIVEDTKKEQPKKKEEIQESEGLDMLDDLGLEEEPVPIKTKVGAQKTVAQKPLTQKAPPPKKLPAKKVEEEDIFKDDDEDEDEGGIGTLKTLDF